MAERHAFSSKDITEGGWSTEIKNKMWERFVVTSKDLGFRVRVTGGNFLTHDIDCSKEDFDTVIELTLGK